MTMALHATEKPKYFRGNNFFLVKQRITASGSYVAAGDVLSLQVLSRTSKKKPVAAWIVVEGYGAMLTYEIGTEKVRVWTNTAGGVNGELTEHTAAALAAGLTGAVIYLYAIFA